MRSIAHALLLTSLVAWPLQPLDDAVRGWILARRDEPTRATMEFVSAKSRLVLFGAAVAGLVAGPAGRAFVAELAIALVPVNLSVEGLKWTVARTRPDGDSHRRNSSFPSSHAANGFALAAVVTHRLRKLAIPAWIVATLVAYSRMVLDRHWLSDVLGSLVLALGGAWLAAWLLARWRSRKAAPREA